MFILSIITLIAVAILFVTLPLTKRNRSDQDRTADDRESLNLEATRQQIKDIENEVENDLIAADQLNAIRSEAETTLLMEMQAGIEPVKADKSAWFHRFTALGLALFIPAVALLVYLSVGTPSALVQTPEDGSQPNLDELVANLQQRLADNPNDQQGWLVLAQTSMMMQRYDQAAIAMEKVYEIAGDSPDVLARYADALVMANNGRFTDRAAQLIEKALELDPEHVHGLWLAGIEAFQAEDFSTAVSFFQRARMNIVDPENLVQIDEMIKTARAKSGTVTKPPEQTGGRSVTVRVELSPQLTDSVKADQTLFVYARAADGPPMPLAVSKHQVSELPLEVSLDDSMAMMPDLALTTFDQVVISARISNSGEPLAQAGDLQGVSAIINPQHAGDVRVIIDQVVE